MSLVTTHAAADRLPVNKFASREGVHPATAWRWILTGIKGHKLRAVRVGGRRFVLESDWQAFCNALNANSTDTPADVTARAERAGAALDERLGDDGSRRRKNANA